MYKCMLFGPMTVEFEEMECEETLGKEEALVEIYYVSLCGSDYSLYHGTYSGPVRYPFVIGHEWSGRIINVNTDFDLFKAGDRVTGDCSGWGMGCDVAKKCKYNKNTCPSIEKFGITKDGFMQERVIVPIRHLYKAQSDMPYDILALTEFFSVALNAVKKANIEQYIDQDNQCEGYKKDKEILILGAGAIGIAICLLLKYKYKIDSVSIYDISEDRLSFIQNIFPDIKISNRKKDEKKLNQYNKLLEQTGIQIVFEATGTENGVKEAIDSCNPNGMVVLVGMYPTSSIELKNVVMKCLDLCGSIGGTGSFLEVIEFLSLNMDVVKRVMTDYVPFHHVTRALNDKNRCCIKRMIRVKENVDNSLEH